MLSARSVRVLQRSSWCGHLRTTAAAAWASTVGCTGVHDVGGRADLVGLPVDVNADAPYHEWELQVSSAVSSLVVNGHFSVHEMRRAIEALQPAAYADLTYCTSCGRLPPHPFWVLVHPRSSPCLRVTRLSHPTLVTWLPDEKWAVAVAAVLEERGLVTAEQLEAAVGPTHGEQWSDTQPKFAAGDAVMVRHVDPGVTWWRKPHLRTPGYLFGAAGVVERLCGVYEDPALGAFRRAAPSQPLYRVRFQQDLVWALAGLRYSGSPADTVDVEVYQPWLVPRPGGYSPDVPTHLVDTSSHGASCPAPGDDAGHHGHDHVHEQRGVVEQRAVDTEGEEPRFKAAAEGLLRLLVHNGLTSWDAIHTGAQRQRDTLGKAYGPAVVARAWSSPAFRDALLHDAHAAILDEFGINTSNPALLGLSPQWYRSREYRANAVRRPRAVLEQFGTEVGAAVSVRVHDSTADMRYMVLPERPAGTDGWTEEQLQKLVSRDSLLGVRRATPPRAGAE